MMDHGGQAAQRILEFEIEHVRRVTFSSSSPSFVRCKRSPFSPEVKYRVSCWERWRQWWWPWRSSRGQPPGIFALASIIMAREWPHHLLGSFTTTLTTPPHRCWDSSTDQSHQTIKLDEHTQIQNLSPRVRVAPSKFSLY
jgi:hypothetical protein